MSEDNQRSKVAAAFNQLAEAREVDIEDVQVIIEDDGLGNTVIDGVDIAEYISEADEEQTPTESEDATEGGDESDDNTTEGGDDVEIHFEEMDYKHLQKLASEELAEYPEDASRDGLIEAMKGQVGIEDSEFHQTPTESDDTTEGSDDGEADISEAELVEAGVKVTNVEDVIHYRSTNGVCSVEDCPYGAYSEDCDYCASHKGSNPKSETSESPKANRELSDLSEAEKGLVSTLIEDEGKSLEEAISMV